MIELYVDSSVIVKRYVVEPGTEIVDEVFGNAEESKLSLTLSSWNIGETLGVLDGKRRRGWISQEEFSGSLRKLVNELLKLLKLRSVQIMPVSSSVLVDTWLLILNQHIYEADALQISSAVNCRCDALLSSDRELVKTAREVGVQAYNVVEEGSQIRKIISR
nr:type II toxin-antitoxin system VapC family toxin [Candidatus Njordarchaeota archaeon]